nr:hypothetical protein [Tanacetum cinerariifolium]
MAAVVDAWRWRGCDDNEEGGARWSRSGSKVTIAAAVWWCYRWFEDVGERRRLGWSRYGVTVAVAVVTAVVVVAL